MLRKWRDAGWMPALPSPGESRRRRRGGWEGDGDRKHRGEGREERERGHRGAEDLQGWKVGRGSRVIHQDQWEAWSLALGKAEGGCGGGRWLLSREGQMVNDMTGLLFFLSGLGTCCPYQVSLAHNILPRKKESSRGRGWCRKLMEDVTNHKIYDKSILSTDHANNLECVFYNNTVSAAWRPRAKNHLKHAVIQLW